MTGGYKALQGVTRGYRGLRGDKGLQRVRTFPDTFSWSILHKNQSFKKSQIFDENDGLTPLEKW